MTSAALPAAPQAATVKAVGLAGLLLLAQAAALGLFEVIPYAVFQHYVDWRTALEGWRLLSVGILLAQILISLAALGPRRIAAWVSFAFSKFGAWRIALAIALSWLCLAFPLGARFEIDSHLGFAFLVAGAGLLNIMALAAALPASGLSQLHASLARRLTLPGESGASRPWDRRLPLIAAAFTLILTALIASLVFEGVPHIDDDIAYLFQAKYFLSGHLYLPPPPDAAAFAGDHLLLSDDRWYSKFFPGWPAVLALGAAVGAPWLVNPVLAGLAVLVAHRLVARLYDTGTAHAVAIMLSLSPWLLFLSASLMGHALPLLLALLALLAIDMQRDRPFGWPSLVAGLSLGALFVTRPIDAVMLGAVAAAWAWGIFGKRLSLVSLATIAATAIASGSLLFLYNTALTGEPLSFPHAKWAEHFWGPGVDVFGFGPKVGIPLWENVDPLPGHGPYDAFLHTQKNLYLTHFELFGLASGSLGFVFLAFLFGVRRPADLLMMSIIAVVIGTHIFYWTPGGPDFGARYWFLAIVPLMVLSVRGAQALAGRLATVDQAAGIRIGTVLACLCVIGFLTTVPWRAAVKYDDYRDIDASVRALERQLDGGLVFVRAPDREEYQSAFIWNPWTLQDGGTIFARDTGPESRAAVVAAYPDRPIWLIGRPAFRRPYVIMQGPLRAGVVPDFAPYEFFASLQADLRNKDDP